MPIAHCPLYLVMQVNTGALAKCVGFIVTLIVWASMVTHAQICSGSLGDPVANLNFGVGSNPGSQLGRNITNYTYLSSGCPNDGFYTIVNSTSNCFNSTWHTVPEDHTTGDANGYMMLANASFAPGDFYVDTVKSLCPNTTYEFAAWVMNVLKSSSCGGNGIMPNLTFKIETTTGAAIGTYQTGDIPQTPTALWKQYGLFFTTPAGINNIVIRIANNARGGCGNDIILDDITFRPCGPVLNAVINNAGDVNTVSVCDDMPQIFSMTATVPAGFNNPAFQWQTSVDSVRWNDINGAVNNSYTRNATPAGSYFYRMAVAEAGNIGVTGCRINSNVLTVRINAKPITGVSVNNPVCEGGELRLSATGGSTYQWTGPSGFSSSLAAPVSIASVSNGGKYVVTVTSDRNCVNKDSLLVAVFPRPAGEAGKDELICEGSSVQLQATGQGRYQWSPALSLSSVVIANPVASPSDTTLYTLTITDQAGCTLKDSLRVFVLKKPVANAGPDVSLYEGQSAVLQGGVKGSNINYYWSPVSFMSNSNTLNPAVNPTNNITYTLFVTSNVGCGTALDDVLVKVFKKVVVPNSFSPNSDGINDTWNIRELSTYNSSVTTVFNRYGQKVFEAYGYPKMWDGTFNGKPVPTGTYYYVIDLKNETPVLSGWVFVVR